MDSDFSQDFADKMKSRMETSYHKYGPWASNRMDVDALANVITRINKYRETGNTEWLIDAANFCMMEFKIPLHPKAHFKATDSKEAPKIDFFPGERLKWK